MNGAEQGNPSMDTIIAPDAEFRLNHNPARMADAERRAILADPGFGRVFTDHMVVVPYSAGRGWHDAELRPFGPIPLSPAAAVLHYAQEVFEGLKAYRLADGGAALFRPDANARRLRASAERLAIPAVPEALFISAIRHLVSADRAWIPDAPGGSLYLRPFIVADEPFLGVRPAASYLFMVIASPVGSYFKAGAQTVTVWVSDSYTRAAPGGTGAAKCGGNYAASLLAQAEATAEGCDQVVFLDAPERRWIEELGGMNVFFVLGNGTLVTPPLGGTILPGITRDCVMTLAAAQGLRVEERPYSIEQWRDDARSGAMTEAFACGTAAVITPIGTVKGSDGEFTIGGARPGPVATALKDALVGIQRGQTPDPYGWSWRLDD